MASVPAIEGVLRELLSPGLRDRWRPASNVFYPRQYPIFLEFFAESAPWTGDRVILAAALAFDWMPRMMESWNLEGVEDALNAYLSSTLSRREKRAALVEAIGLFLNGTLTGTSKFLHFFDPNNFAILDRYVVRALGLHKLKNVHKDKVTYLAYLDAIDAVPTNMAQDLKSLAAIYHHPYCSVGKLRAVELALYLSGKALARAP